MFLSCLNIEKHVVTMNLNNKPENLREDLGENEPIFQLAEHKIGKNNTKSVKCCKVFRLHDRTNYPS